MPVSLDIHASNVSPRPPKVSPETAFIPKSGTAKTAADPKSIKKHRHALRRAGGNALGYGCHVKTCGSV